MRSHGEEAPPDPRWQQNVAAVAEWDPWRWSSWFLSASAERDFEPVAIHPQARLTAEVAELYRRVRERTRFAMRRGVAEALRTWSVDAYGGGAFGVLNQLVWIVEKVRATEAIPILLHIVRDHRDLLCGDRKALSAADNIISIVGGFPADRATEEVFSDLLFDDATPPELTSLLAVTIAGASSTRFADCLDRYVAVSARAPAGFFHHESVVNSFAAAVPRQAIENGLAKASPRAWVYWMMHGVGETIDRAAIFAFDVEERTDIPNEALSPPEEQTFDALSDMYEHIHDLTATPKTDAEGQRDSGMTIIESQQVDADNLQTTEGDDKWADESEKRGA